MPAFAQKYTDDQKQALASAVIDETQGRKLTAQQALTLLLNGKLGVDAPSSMPLTTARDIIKLERRRRAGTELSKLAKQPHHKAVDAMRAAMLSLAERELHVLQDKAAKKGGTVELDRLSKLADLVARIDKLAPRTVSPPQGKTKGQADSGRPRASTIAEQLIAADRNGHTAPSQPETLREEGRTPEPTDNGPGPRTSQPAETQHGRVLGGVRASARGAAAVAGGGNEAGVGEAA